MQSLRSGAWFRCLGGMGAVRSRLRSRAGRDGAHDELAQRDADLLQVFDAARDAVFGEACVFVQGRASPPLANSSFTISRPGSAKGRMAVVRELGHQRRLAAVGAAGDDNGGWFVIRGNVACSTAAIRRSLPRQSGGRNARLMLLGGDADGRPWPGQRQQRMSLITSPIGSSSPPSPVSTLEGSPEMWCVSVERSHRAPGAGYASAPLLLRNRSSPAWIK